MPATQILRRFSKVTRGILIALVTVAACCAPPAHAQSPPGSPGLPPAPSAPSGNAKEATARPAATDGLPRDAGQVWRTYDIRRYTDRRASELHPEQAIVDWIVRETGTEVWFAEPAGMLTANRRIIRVYHTPAIQEVVGKIVARFIRPETETAAFGVRIITVNTPNWRTHAVTRMRSVKTQTPGTEAWLCSHEDAALIVADLKKQTGFREHSSPNLMILNGDTHTIERTRPKSYVRGVRPSTIHIPIPGEPAPTAINPTLPSDAPRDVSVDMAQINEGFKLRITPLVANDADNVDTIVHIESHQIEQFKNITIPTPSRLKPLQRTTIQVPQTSAWRLHEQFHWPNNQVLIISCGMVASPAAERRLPTLISAARAPRCDALILIDAKGIAKERTARYNRKKEPDNLQYRGRY